MQVTKEGDKYIIHIIDNSKYDSLHKEEIITHIKEIILKINSMYKLKLRGFYKVKVYFHELIGTVIEITCVDDENYMDIDLKVLVYFNSDFYLQIDDYDNIPNNKSIIYYDNNYYIDVDLLTKQEFLSLIENSNIIYDIEDITNLYYGEVIMT